MYAKEKTMVDHMDIWRDSETGDMIVTCRDHGIAHGKATADKLRWADVPAPRGCDYCAAAQGGRR